MTRNEKIYGYKPKPWHEHYVRIPVWFLVTLAAIMIAGYAFGYITHRTDYRIEDFHG